MAGYSNQVITIKKGLNIPIAGEPKQVIEDTKSSTHVALLGEEYIGLKPTMLVEVGDTVQKGQALFEDKKTPGVIYTAPASGKIVAINRGERRLFQSIIIECNNDAPKTFASSKAFNELSREDIQAKLFESGLWTALRTRPFSKVP